MLNTSLCTYGELIFDLELKIQQKHVELTSLFSYRHKVLY